MILLLAKRVVCTALSYTVTTFVLLSCIIVVDQGWLIPFKTCVVTAAIATCVGGILCGFAYACICKTRNRLFRLDYFTYVSVATAVILAMCLDVPEIAANTWISGVTAFSPASNEIDFQWSDDGSSDYYIVRYLYEGLRTRSRAASFVFRSLPLSITEYEVGRAEVEDMPLTPSRRYLYSISRIGPANNQIPVASISHATVGADQPAEAASYAATIWAVCLRTISKNVLAVVVLPFACGVVLSLPLRKRRPRLGLNPFEVLR